MVSKHEDKVGGFWNPAASNPYNLGFCLSWIWLHQLVVSESHGDVSFLWYRNELFQYSFLLQDGLVKSKRFLPSSVSWYWEVLGLIETPKQEERNLFHVLYLVVFIRRKTQWFFVSFFLLLFYSNKTLQSWYNDE